MRYNYYPILLNTPIDRLYSAEYKIEDNGKIFENINFIGFIDRIDKNDDNSYTIYDYKTGNNKNSSIKPDGDHEDYYNQIAFYKYYFEKLTNKKVKYTQFIYPEDFKTKNDSFELTDEECEKIVSKIKIAVDKINNCCFEPSYNKNTCQYCQYKDFCETDIIW